MPILAATTQLWLHCTSIETSVSALDGVGDDVFELAPLIAAEGERRVAVFPLGVDLDLGAAMLRQPRQPFDMRRPAGGRIVFEFFQHRRPPLVA